MLLSHMFTEKGIDMCGCNKPAVRQDLTVQAAQELIDQAVAAQKENEVLQAQQS